MRPSLPPACAVLTTCLFCLFTFGCSGGTPFGAGGDISTKAPAVSTPVTTPVTPVSSGPAQNAAVSVMISDPAACRAPNGPWTHVYITIADVRASTNPDAAVDDPSFVDLTPGLSSVPQQVDLLGQANSKCFLASLSISKAVAAGNYQQVRIFLAPDSAASNVQKNACGASYSNCLVRTDNSLHDLQLAAATAKGIVVPASEISNASIPLNSGDQASVDVDFDICSSILAALDGGYEFNPVVNVGLIPSTGGSISGTVVSSTTGQGLKGGQVVVALEQKDSATGIDRILMRTVASSNGAFTLCPVPQGTYDLVVVGVDGANTSYSAGVETGIQAGQVAGQIPLVPGTAQGTLQGLIMTQSAALQPSGISVAVKANALQQIAGGATITVPLLPSQNPYNEAMLTENRGTCIAGVDCASFAMDLPSTSPNVVACSQQTAQFTQQKDSTPSYTAESVAQIPGSGGTPDCRNSNLTVATTPQGASLELGPDQSTAAANMTYSQCQ